MAAVALCGWFTLRWKIGFFSILKFSIVFFAVGAKNVNTFFREIVPP